MPPLPNAIVAKTCQWSRSVPRKAWVIGAVTVVVVLSVVTIGRNFASNQREWLFGGRKFGSEQLIAVEAALSEAGLLEYRIENDRVSVPRQRRTQYIAALGKAGALPEGIETEMDPLLKRPDFLETPSQRQLRYKVAKQRQLARLVKSLEGIDEAYVQYDVKGSGSFKKTVVATATVAVRPTAGTLLGPTRLRSIRQLVAGSIADLRLTDITVTDLSTNFSYAGDDDPSIQIEHERLLLKTKYEEEWIAKITNVLSFIPDIGVVANVALGKATENGDGQSNVGENGHLRTKRLTVSVTVPSRYHRMLWEQENADTADSSMPVPDESDLQRLAQETEQTIRSAILGLHPQASVRVLTVNEVASHDQQELADISLWLRRNSWLFTLALGVCLASFAIWWFRVDESTEVAAPECEPEEPTPTIAAPICVESPPSITIDEPVCESSDVEVVSRVHEELTQVVRENPNAAAQVLKDWLKKAG